MIQKIFTTQKIIIFHLATSLITCNPTSQSSTQLKPRQNRPLSPLSKTPQAPQKPSIEVCCEPPPPLLRVTCPEPNPINPQTHLFNPSFNLRIYQSCIYFFFNFPPSISKTRFFFSARSTEWGRENGGQTRRREKSKRKRER